jgi:hypothetical protein
MRFVLVYFFFHFFKFIFFSFVHQHYSIEDWTLLFLFICFLLNFFTDFEIVSGNLESFYFSFFFQSSLDHFIFIFFDFILQYKLVSNWTFLCSTSLGFYGLHIWGIGPNLEGSVRFAWFFSFFKLIFFSFIIQYLYC